MSTYPVKLTNSAFTEIKTLVINHKDLVLLNGSTDEIFTVPIYYDNTEDREATTNIVAEWMKDIKGMIKEIHSTSTDTEISAQAQAVMSYCDAVITTVTQK